MRRKFLWKTVYRNFKNVFNHFASFIKSFLYRLSKAWNSNELKQETIITRPPHQVKIDQIAKKQHFEQTREKQQSPSFMRKKSSILNYSQSHITPDTSRKSQHAWLWLGGKWCQMCSKLKTITPERRQWRVFIWTYFKPLSAVSIVHFEKVNVSLVISSGDFNYQRIL